MFFLKNQWSLSALVNKKLFWWNGQAELESNWKVESLKRKMKHFLKAKSKSEKKIEKLKAKNKSFIYITFPSFSQANCVHELLTSMVGGSLKTFGKTFLVGKQDFVKMCQGKCGKLAQKVTTLQLGRSMNYGTFLPPPQILFFSDISSSIWPREKLLRQKMFLVKFPTW